MMLTTRTTATAQTWAWLRQQCTLKAAGHSPSSQDCRQQHVHGRGASRGRGQQVCRARSAVSTQGGSAEPRRQRSKGAESCRQGVYQSWGGRTWSPWPGRSRMNTAAAVSRMNLVRVTALLAQIATQVSAHFQLQAGRTEHVPERRAAICAIHRQDRKKKAAV